MPAASPTCPASASATSPTAAGPDQAVGDVRIRPDAQAGCRACEAAAIDRPAEGNMGGGAGATVGKLFGARRAMKGGIGMASLRVTELTRHVFETIEVESVYRRTLQELAEDESAEDVLALFPRGLSLSAQAYLLALYAKRVGNVK